MASIVVSGDTSGAITIAAPAASGTNTLTLPAATDTLVGKATTDTLTNKTLTSPTISSPTISGTPVMSASVITSGTAVASTSGTSIDFTGIPSWVKRVTVQFVGVSTSGTNNYLIQIGSGSVTTSGYTSQAFSFTNNGTTSSTAGFLLTYLVGAADTLRGAITLSLQSSSTNTWVDSGMLVDGLRGHFFAGSVALAGAIDRVRITTVGGTDTFDAGSINIQYE